MRCKKDLLYKIKEICKLMGDKAVFRIGVDTKNRAIDLLSVDVCFPEEDSKEIIADLPEYIG